MTQITVVQGDITAQEVDAIVNNATSTLQGGGGVDSAIHAAAGPGLMEECRLLGGCRTGEAKITKGYNLPAKFVIHAVGPIYGQESGEEAKILEKSHMSILRIAKDHEAKTIALPAISTGIFGYPLEEAAEIAIKAVKDFVELHPNAFEEIRFVLYYEYDFKVFKKALDKVFPPSGSRILDYD